MPFLLAQDGAPAEAAPPADAAGGGAQPAPAPSFVQFVPFILMGLVFWFLLIRPQRKQEKERQKRVDALKKGDRVRTRGGIVAPVIRVKDDEVIVALGGDRSVEVSIHKGYVDEVLSADGKSGGSGK